MKQTISSLGSGNSMKTSQRLQELNKPRSLVRLFKKLKMDPIPTEYKKFVGDLKTVEVAYQMKKPVDQTPVEIKPDRVRSKSKKMKKKPLYKVPPEQIETYDAAFQLFKQEEQKYEPDWESEINGDEVDAAKSTNRDLA